MIDPRFAEHLSAESAFVVPVPFFPRAAFRKSAESMSARAQRDNRYATVQRALETFHRVIIPMTEAQRHHDGVRRTERFRMRKAVAGVRIDHAVRIDREQHRALEAM